MDEIDIFQRTLKCRDLPVEETESEILSIESIEAIEEEAEPEEAPEVVIDPEGLNNEMECVYRRIQKLLILLQTKTDPCFKRPCVKAQVICVDEKDICELQKAHHILQCQINELIRCFRLIRNEIRELHAHICHKNKDIEQLQFLASQLQYYRQAMAPDDGVCLQRYVYIKDKKAHWCSTKGLFKDASCCPVKLMENYLQRRNFEIDKYFMQADLERFKALFVALFEMKDRDFIRCCGFDSKRSLLQLEKDFIEREIKKRAKANTFCVPIFKCDYDSWM